MACDALVAECLAFHYAPKLGGPKISESMLSVRARCPACTTARALTVTAGRHQRVVWHCHSGCEGDAVRQALVKAGVPRGCLPTGDGVEVSLADVVAAAVLDSGNVGTAKARVTAIMSGLVRWPKGAGLLELATSARISRSAVYLAADGPLLPPPGNHQFHLIEPQAVKDPQVSTAIPGAVDVPATGQIPATGQPDVPATGQNGRVEKTPVRTAEEKKALVLSLRAEGMAVREIAQQTGVITQWVGRWIEAEEGKTMTNDVIERREYTYCQASYTEPFTIRRFLVMTPGKSEARRRAMEYARHRWGEPDRIHVYPRNYILRARELYASGDHD